MLDSIQLEKVPETVFCISNFVNEQEEENTLRNIHKAPKPKWTNLLNRRLQNWGGLPKPKVLSYLLTWHI
jgi:alkylated DNA repair protein alkB family protein 6